MNRGADDGGGAVLTVELLLEENRQLRERLTALERPNLIGDLVRSHQESLPPLNGLDCALQKLVEVSSLFGRLSEETARCSGENERLSAENRKFSDDNKRLEARIRVLEEQLLQAQRESKRQAAPFRRKTRIPKSQQKKSGRPDGHKPAWRPRPSNVDETTHVPLVCNCPDCGECLEDIKEHEHFVVDVPPVKPTTTRVVTYSGKCPRCKARHQSKHPDMASTAAGAAGITLGPNVVAIAALMRTQLGAPLRRIAAFLSHVFGLSVSAAGVLGALKRLTQALTPTYQGLMTSLQTCKVLHVDETGWRLCSESAWLWVFTNKEVTIYVIRPSRGKKVLLEVLGREFSGWLVTDCLATYDTPLFPNKAKCVAHFFRSLSELEALHAKPAPAALPAAKKQRQSVPGEVGTPKDAAPVNETNPRQIVLAEELAIQSTETNRIFPEKAMSILTMAVNLKRTQPQLSGEIYQGTRAVIDHLLDNLLQQDITEPNNLRLANRMRKHRQAMLAFLDHVEVEPTNNHAERQIRPAVLQRKISAGNRSEGGARVHETLLSIYATAMQQGQAFLTLAMQALRKPLDPVMTLPVRGP